MTTETLGRAAVTGQSKGVGRRRHSTRLARCSGAVARTIAAGAGRREPAGAGNRAGVTVVPSEQHTRQSVLFPTIRFAIFFALVLPTSWLLLPHPRRWRVFMVLASFVFYASWNNGYVVLLAGSIVGNQLLAPPDPLVRRALAGALDRPRGGGQPRRARLVQVRGLRRRQRIDVPRLVRHRRAHRRAEPAAPGRHLVLHVPSALVRDRRAPPAVRAGVVPRLRRLPVVLPAPRRRADRAGQRAAAPAPCQSRPALGQRRAGVLADLRRACSRRW